MYQAGEAKKNGVVYSTLKELVVNGRFRPGEQLHINALSDQLHVSITPVREALNRLYGEALIVAAPNRGFFFKAPEFQEMVALHELAYLVLHHSIENGLPDATSGDLEMPFALALTIDGDSFGSSKTLAQTHALTIEKLLEKIASFSKNHEIVNIVRNFSDRSHFIRIIDLEFDLNRRTILQNISELIEAVQRRAVAVAIKLLRNKFDQRLSRMSELVKEGIVRAFASPSH